ncbi:isochorismatase family protein [Paenibacillus turicensis]|uniref:cysteine hydrolase family protein n=1 Tax=Paenibacillus turicensis TaxID=160487 RepID=UPI003D2C97F8
MTIALLVVDMQQQILQNKIEGKMIEQACEYINHVSALLRAREHLVVHVQDVEGIEVGYPHNYELIPEVDVTAEDIIISKKHSNAFWQTALEQTLLDHQVELVIVAGFAAEDCVLFTYNGAIERGFNAVILQNGILSQYPDVITSTYRDRNLISYPAVEYLCNLYLSIDQDEHRGGTDFESL